MSLAERCASIEKNESVDLTLMSSLESRFRSSSCLNGSFLVSNGSHINCTTKNPGINIGDADIAFRFLRKMEHPSLRSIVWFLIIIKLILNFSNFVGHFLKFVFLFSLFFDKQIFEGITTQIIPSLTSSPADVEVLRIYLLLPFYHEFIKPRNYEQLQAPFGRAVLNLTPIAQIVVRHWWMDQTISYFEQLVESFKGVVLHIIVSKHDKINKSGTVRLFVTYDSNLDSALKMLELLLQVNSQRKDRLSYEAFYLPDITDKIDLQKDFYRWQQSHGTVSITFSVTYEKSQKTKM